MNPTPSVPSTKSTQLTASFGSFYPRKNKPTSKGAIPNHSTMIRPRPLPGDELAVYFSDKPYIILEEGDNDV